MQPTNNTSSQSFTSAGIDPNFCAQFGLTILPNAPINGSSNTVRYYVRSKDGKEIAEVRPHQIKEILQSDYFTNYGSILPGATRIDWRYKERATTTPRAPKHDDRIGSLKINFADYYNVEIHAKVNGKTRHFTHPNIRGSSLIRHMRAEVDKGAYQFIIKTDYSRRFSAKQVIDAAAVDKSTPKARRDAPTLTPGKHNLRLTIKQEYDDGDHTPINLWMSITIDDDLTNTEKPFLALNQLMGEKWRDLFWMRFSGHLNFAQTDYTVKRDRPGRYYVTQPKGDKREISALDLQSFFSMFADVNHVTVTQHGKPNADVDAIAAEQMIANNAPTPVDTMPSALDSAAALALIKSEFPNLTPREQIALAKELIA